jgi:hypothetical protein
MNTSTPSVYLPQPTRMSPWAAAALFFFILGQLGCAAKKQIAFAHAGTVYANSLDSLLTRSEAAAVDATSERLLQDDQLSNQTVASYARLSSIDEQRLEITSRLRKHARLLARYFAALDQLSSSKAPDQAEQSITGVADQLNTLGDELRHSPLISNSSIVSKAAGFAVGQIRNKMLRDELAKRHDALDRELATEEALISALGRAIEHDVDLAREAREQREVIDPLVATAPISNPDAWIAARRETLLSSKRIAELDTAVEAVRALRMAFDQLCSGNSDKTTVRSLLSDVEGMLSSAQ